MANPSVRSASRVSSGVATEPAGAASGDILVAWVSSNSTLPTAPSGWVKDIDLPWSGATNRLTSWTIKRGASAPALTWTSGGTIFSVDILCVQDADQTTWVDAAGQSLDNATSTTPSSPSITTTSANALILVCIFTAGSPTITVPTGTTQNTNNSADGVATANVSQAGAGASGAKQWSLSVTDITATGTMAIRAVSSAADPIPTAPQQRAPYRRLAPNAVAIMAAQPWLLQTSPVLAPVPVPALQRAPYYRPPPPLPQRADQRWILTAPFIPLARVPVAPFQYAPYQRKFVPNPIQLDTSWILRLPVFVQSAIPVAPLQTAAYQRTSQYPRQPLQSMLLFTTVVQDSVPNLVQQSANYAKPAWQYPAQAKFAVELFSTPVAQDIVPTLNPQFASYARAPWQYPTANLFKDKLLITPVVLDTVPTPLQQRAPYVRFRFEYPKQLTPPAIPSTITPIPVVVREQTDRWPIHHPREKEPKKLVAKIKEAIKAVFVKPKPFVLPNEEIRAKLDQAVAEELANHVAINDEEQKTEEENIEFLLLH